MKKLLAMALALVMCLGVTTIAWAEETASALADSVYVSVSDGDDTNDGTQNNPVKSLQKAMELVKENGTVYILDASIDGSTFFHGYYGGTDTGRPIPYITKSVTISGNTTSANKTKITGSALSWLSTVIGEGKPDDGTGYNQNYLLTDATVKFANLNFESTIGLNNLSNKLSGVTLAFEHCDFTGVAIGNGTYIAVNIGCGLKKLLINDCTFTAADSSYGKGYLVWAGAQNIEISNSVFDGNEKLCGAIHLGDGSDDFAVNATVSDNTIKNVERGIQMAFSKDKEDKVQIDNNTFEDIQKIGGSAVGAVVLHENMVKDTKAEVTYDASNKLTGKTEVGILAKVGSNDEAVDVTKVVKPTGGELVKNEDGSYSVVKNTPEQTPPRYYYNSTTTTDTKADGTKGSPKTFDAGVGIYAVSAVLSLTGMAYVGKRKF